MFLRALIAFITLPGLAAILATAFHIRVLIYEEPWLREEFGSDWEVYERSVSRWLPGRAFTPPNIPL